jgi:hypothetical protein
MPFIELEGSLSFTQEIATAYPEPDETSPHPPTLFTEYPFHSILPIGA